MRVRSYCRSALPFLNLSEYRNLIQSDTLRKSFIAVSWASAALE